jgi:hypothetical protein
MLIQLRRYLTLGRIGGKIAVGVKGNISHVISF